MNDYKSFPELKEEEIATTYKEYKNGAKQVAGLGRLGCYQGLYYLNKLLEEDKYYSEKLEDSIVFIESHINRIEKENQKYKEVIDKAINNSQDWIDYYTRLNSDERIALRLQENIDILKEVIK